MSEVCFSVGSSGSMLCRCLFGFAVYGVIALFVDGGGFLLLYVLLGGVGFDLGYGDGVWLVIVSLPEVFPEVGVWSVRCSAPGFACIEASDNVFAVGFDVYVASHVFGCLEEGI